ncbi:TPA: molybdate ABC transporter permease subunit, partial [Vibrio cholerae]
LCAISIAIALGSLFISEWLSRRMQRRLGLTS